MPPSPRVTVQQMERALRMQGFRPNPRGMSVEWRHEDGRSARVPHGVGSALPSDHVHSILERTRIPAHRLR